MAERGKSFLKQAQNTHRQKLRALLTEKGAVIPDCLNSTANISQNISSSTAKSSSRKFISRSKRKRKLNYKTKELEKSDEIKQVGYVENSHFNLTMQSLILFDLRKKIH